MSIIDTLTSKLADKAADVAGDPEHVTKLIELARGQLPSGDGAEEKAIREAAEFALTKLEGHKARLAKMSESQLVAFLARVGIGQASKAANTYAGAKPGSRWEAAHRAIDAAADATEQAKRDYDDGLALAKEIGSAVAKAALPLLMAVV